MTALRSLLRLDEKMAAETRRIEGLGAPPTRWALPAAIVLAVAAHAAALLMPLPRLPDPGEARSPRPDLPSVWRTGLPAGAEAAVAAAPPVGATDRPRPPAPRPGGAPRVGFAEIDPVPEPAPDLGTSGIPAEIEALIPSPDALPRAVDRPVPGDPSADLVPVTRVSPAFPALARSVRAEGSVSLIASIAADGHVEDARLVGCSRPGVGFESAAMEAVRRWKYPPAPPGSAAREVALRIEFRGGGAAR